MNRIYLDNAATTPILPEVFHSMQPWLCSDFGNPSSLYSEGRKARAAIDAARETLTQTLKCLFGELIFTSSGTEAAFLALIGVALGCKKSDRKRILVGAAEHDCVLNTRPILEALGFQVEAIPVDNQARVIESDYQHLLDQDVLLVSIMHANNEFGSINPIHELAQQAHFVGALFHTDAVQSFLMPLSVEKSCWNLQDLGVDLLSISAHKVHGPKGVGALYIKAGTPFQTPIKGGGQERELRGGTENVAGIVGFAAAVNELSNKKDIWELKSDLRQRFINVLQDQHRIDFQLTTDLSKPILPGHLHLQFNGISAESLLIVLDRMGVSASSGSACSSGSIEPSHVMLACGYSKELASESVRFSFGLLNTVAEVEGAAFRVAQAINQIRQCS
jgi:cysteine desulfurase